MIRKTIINLSASALFIVVAHVDALAAVDQTGAGVGLLLSDKKSERERSLEQINAHYLEVSGVLSKAIHDVAENGRSDRRYHSPLHCAILAVETWHVLDTDGMLLSIADYELDATSIPLGISLLGDDFFPAAKALVRLRVDTKKLVEHIKNSKTREKMRVLTWVLLQRAGCTEDARILLDAAARTSLAAEAVNLWSATELLKRPSDILPPPGSGR